jgi:hypothetical protein
LERGGIAAPVEEQHDLLLPIETRLDALLQRLGENRRTLRFACLVAHVHDPDQRKLAIIDSGGHLEQGILPALGVVVTLHRGSGRAQHHDGTFHLAADNRDIAGVISRRLLLLVGVLMLLIDNDQPEGFYGGKDGRAGPDHDPSAALPDLVPLVVTLPSGQMAVEHRHQGLVFAGRKAGFEALDGLRGEGNFRHQHNRAATAVHRFGNGLQVDLGLTAAGDTMQKKSGRSADVYGWLFGTLSFEFRLAWGLVERLN